VEEVRRFGDSEMGRLRDWGTEGEREELGERGRNWGRGGGGGG
jgi:hypothetical protein